MISCRCPDMFGLEVCIMNRLREQPWFVSSRVYTSSRQKRNTNSCTFSRMKSLRFLRSNGVMILLFATRYTTFERHAEITFLTKVSAAIVRVPEPAVLCWMDLRMPSMMSSYFAYLEVISFSMVMDSDSTTLLRTDSFLTSDKNCEMAAAALAGLALEIETSSALIEPRSYELAHS